MNRFLFGIAMLFLFTALNAQNRSHNIFVDGSYGSKNSDHDVNELIDDRLKKLKEAVESQTKNEDVSTEVDSKQKLIDALKGIQCGCDDEINLYMMGHGNKGKFIFSEFSKHSEKYITADELRTLLSEAAVECCCKINVVIFSCHSGSMISPLMEEEHVHSVFTSCQPDEKSFSDAHYEAGKFVDNGDWMKGFHEDLKAVRGAENMAKANQIASLSAEEKMPEDFAKKEHPAGWVRGEQNVLCHVERIEYVREKKVQEGQKRKRKFIKRILVTIHEPEFLRGMKKWVDVDTADYKILHDTYEHCNWISFTGDFSAPGDRDLKDQENKRHKIIDVTSPIKSEEAPSVDIMAHIIQRLNSNKAEIHVLRPKNMHCTKRTLNAAALDRKLKPCTYIESTVKLTDPLKSIDTDDELAPVPAEFNVKVHVKGSKGRDNFHCVIKTPEWLAESYKGRLLKILVDRNEQWKIRQLDECNHYFLSLKLQPDGWAYGRNIRSSTDPIEWHNDRDLALHNVGSPENFSLVCSFDPKLYITNVGKEICSGELRVCIGSPDLIDEMKQWLIQPFETNRFYTTSLETGVLKKAETAIMRCRPFQAPLRGRKYAMVARVIGENDQNQDNDFQEMVFVVPYHEKPVSPGKSERMFKGEVAPVKADSLIYSARGTGRTTGHIANLFIENPTDDAVEVTIGPFIIPTTGNYQSYFVPESLTKHLPAGAKLTVPLNGYCLVIRKKPVPDGQEMVPVEKWLTPSLTYPDKAVTPTSLKIDVTDLPNLGKEQALVTTIPFPNTTAQGHPMSSAVLESNSYERRPDEDKDNITITYPGTDIKFPYRIDLDKNLEQAAPFIFYTVPALIEAYNEIERDPNKTVATPYDLLPDKEKDVCLQQAVWIGMAELEGDDYTLEEFRDNLASQFETTSGTTIDDAPQEQKEAFDTGVNQFWDAFTLIGVEAKVLRETSDEGDVIEQKE